MNSMKKRILASVGVVIGLVASLALGIFRGAYADTDYVTKGTVSALVSCYENGAFKTPVGTTSFTSSTRGSTSMFLEGNQTVYVPIGYSGDTVKTKCADLIGGMITSRGISIPSGADSATQVDAFLTSLGYTMASSETASNTGRCFSVTYEKVYDWLDASTPSTSETLTTQRVCADAVENDIIQVDKLTIEGGDTSIIQFQDARVGSIKIDCQIGGLPSLGNCNDPSHDFVKGQTKWSDFVEGIRQDLVAHKSQGTDYHPILGYMVSYELKGLSDGEVETNDESAAVVNAEYTMSASANAITKGTETLAGWATNAKPAFSDDEKFRLYQAYLNNYYKADTKCSLSDDQQTSVQGNGYSEINYCTTSGVQACYVKPMAHTNDSVGGVENGVFGSDCDFNCVADFMKNYDNESACVSSSTDPEQPQDNSTGFNGNTATDGEIIDCNGFQNIGPTQWSLCPTANNMQYTANALDKITENMVQIDADVYNNTTVEQVWSRIRDIANVLMVVLLLVIVFSQLTGYGIDNYGIKKMLPRLILMAILINLSFYICQLAIDLSNILGVGLRNMFGGIGNSVGGQDGLSYVGTMIGGVFTGLAASSGAVSGGVGVGVAIFSLGASVAVAAWVAVLVVLLLIVVAVVIFFLSLGIRKILVIVCIILAPLAFAAYILPNTQRLFKNWWNLFKACLIIFPICGALSGISYLLKSMSQGTQLGAAASLVMMVLPYAGFFLIPMLVNSAISALGKIGGAVTAMGQSLRSGAQTLGKAGMKVAQNTEGYKNAQFEAAKKRQAASADRTIAKLGEIKEGDLTKEQRIRLARAHETKRRLGNEDIAAKEILMDQKYGNTSMQELGDIWEGYLRGGNVDDRTALENLIVRRHGSVGVKDLGDRLAKDENKFFDDNTGNFINENMEKSFNSIRSNLAENSTFGNAMHNKVVDVSQMFTNGGYSEKDANGGYIVDDTGKRVARRQNLAAHTKNNNTAAQVKDWASQGSSTLRRAIMAGALDKEMAEQILSSPDPGVRDGILSEKPKLQMLQAAAMGYRGDFKNEDEIKRLAEQYEATHGGSSNPVPVVSADFGPDTHNPAPSTPAVPSTPRTSAGTPTVSAATPTVSAGSQNYTRSTSSSSAGDVFDVHAAAQMEQRAATQTAGRATTTQLANAPKITGDFLASRNVDDLRYLAQAAENAGMGSQTYNDFMSATNEIARRPELLTNLGNEQRELISRVRRISRPNDTTFGGPKT